MQASCICHHEPAGAGLQRSRFEGLGIDRARSPRRSRRRRAAVRRQRERRQDNRRLVSCGARPRNSWRRLSRWHRARQVVHIHSLAAERHQRAVGDQGAASSWGQAERRRFFHQGVGLGSRRRDASRRRRRSSGGRWARIASMVRSKPTNTAARSSGDMPMTCVASEAIESRSLR